jgi:hypothetical protein
VVITPSRPCISCGTLVKGRSYCQRCQPRRKTRGRSSRPQDSFRTAVLDRAGHRCQYLDDQGRRCIATENLEAHHLRPFAEDPTYDPTAGVALCPRCHHEVERRKHEADMQAAWALAQRGIEYWR